MATVNLGAIRFNWKGAYNNGTAYVVDDVVSSAGNSYICILASTGNAVSNATYWSIMSSAGTDGTDLTSTMTTQGDILFRDGSGLQRLAKGTAAQSLTMNSGATAPEWTTPAAGGWTLIGSATASTSSSITVTGLTGLPAMIVGRGLKPVNNDKNLKMRLGDSSGIDSGSSDYSMGLYGIVADSNGTISEGAVGFDNINVSALEMTGSSPLGNVGNSSGDGVSFTAFMEDSRGSNQYPVIHGTAVATKSGVTSQHTYHCQRNAFISTDRIEFWFHGDTIASGSFYVYELAIT